MSDELPEGWVLATLGDTLEAKYGKGLKASTRKNGSILVYGSNGVVGWHDRALTQGPTIILGRKGTIGTVHYSPAPCWPIDTTYFIDEFIGLDPDFLVYALGNLNLPELDASSAIPGLNRDSLYDQPIQIAPLAEQKRIVAKVEGLLVHVNAARERLARVPTILKRFRQSVLAAACSGRLSETWRSCESESRHGSNTLADVRNRTPGEKGETYPEEWPSCTLAAVCSAVVDCPHSTPKWTETGEICLRTTNFRPGWLDLSEVRFVSPATYRERIMRLEPQAGDVLYSREGGILGIACMMPPNLCACLGQRMMLMRTNGQMQPEFLMHVLNSPLILEVVKSLTGGTASPHLNVGDVKAFSIPVPPLSEQREIVRRIDALFALADAIEKRVAAATQRVEKLTQAILAKAFRGELVPTEAELARQEGRDYEPAAVLLERIQAERARIPSAAKRASRRRKV